MHNIEHILYDTEFEKKGFFTSLINLNWMLLKIAQPAQKSPKHVVAWPYVLGMSSANLIATKFEIWIYIFLTET